MTDQPYFTDDTVTLHHGDALAVLAGMPDGSVDCIVTSPPYFGLRDYGVTGTAWPDTNLAPTGRQHLTPDTNGGRNPGDVWTIPTVPFSEAHFAVFPPTLAEKCILAGCKPGGTVLDPFSGSGTTGMVAARHGHRYVGIDANRDFLDLSLRTRLLQGALIEGDTP